MKKQNLWKIARVYFLRHVKIMLAYFLFTGIFCVVFYLYSLPVEAVVYAAVLCLCAGLLLALYDFLQFRKRYEVLEALKSQVILSPDSLPPPGDGLEAQYQDLLRILYEYRSHLISEADKTRTEMLDYYTLWAHQIKTPISAMNLLLQSQDGANSAALSAELFKIEQYVGMVLQYLRLESMSSDLVLKRYDLDSIVRQAVRKYAKLFVLGRIRLCYDPLNVAVLTDEKWLCFVIEQLLSNAIKYTNEGSVSLYMEEDAPKTLVIEDTGIGIEPEDLPRVFERGFTGYNGRTDKKSTGIGLYLCRQIMNRLSHRITIESEVGRGTRVFLDLDTLDLKVE